MIKSGLKPNKIDHRDWDFHKSFGAIPVPFPLNFTTDAGLRSKPSFSPAPTITRSYLDSVFSIFQISAPLQIIHRVVGFHAIFVVHLWQLIRINNESPCHQSVNKEMFSLIVFQQNNGFVTSIQKIRLKKLALMFTNIARHPLFWITPNSAIFRNRILALEPFNIFHKSKAKAKVQDALRVSCTSAAKLITI